MQISTQGIVLQTVNYSDTAVIAKIFTLHHGLVSFMVKGVRKKNARFAANLFSPCSILSMNYLFKVNKNLQFVNEISCDVSLTNLQSNPLKSCIAFFMAEVCVKSIKEQEQDELLFDCIRHFIELLNDTEESIKQFHHYFLLQLANKLGFGPQGIYDDKHTVFDLREGIFQSSYPVYPEFVINRTAELISLFTNSTFENSISITATKAERNSLLATLLFYFDLHVLHGSKIKSTDVLSEMMA
ncbi:MAG: DNA repair protein RecO [Bacteroidetes bacterium]|nr:DNA repair protein RecO [Bacteroidota bacterium]